MSSIIFIASSTAGTDAVLGFTLPARGRILVLAPDAAVLYDSRVDGPDVYAPAGSYVFFAGVAGDTFHIRAESSLLPP